MKSLATRVSVKRGDQRYPQQSQPHEPIYAQYNTVKPKSWDNLATKAFGGYGFGYGYIDAGSKSCASAKTTRQKTQYVRIAADKHPNTCAQHAQRRHFHPTKSTESLLVPAKYSAEALSDSSVSCECLDGVASPGHQENAESRFFHSPRQSVVSPTDPNFGYYSARQQHQKGNGAVSTSSEATRL